MMHLRCLIAGKNSRNLRIFIVSNSFAWELGRVNFLTIIKSGTRVIGMSCPTINWPIEHALSLEISVSPVSVTCINNGASVEGRLCTHLDIEGEGNVFESDLTGDGVQLVGVDEAVNDEHQLGERG